jgi:hypothetical protein
MTEPWFDANSYAWIPGTALGCLTGLWGSLAGVFVPQGKGKGLIYGMAVLLLGSAVVLLALGVYALFTGQPYGIWYGLGFPGLLTLVLMTLFSAVVIGGYRKAEERRMSAQDIR